MTADKDRGTQKNGAARDGRTTGFDPRAHMRQLKGQDYLEARWRVVWFREENPDGQIQTDIVYHDREKKEVLFRATVTVPGSGASATGYCEGSEREFKFGYLEKAETQSVGRALAFLGYGTAQAAELDIGEGDKPADSPLEATQAPPRPAAHARAAAVPHREGPTPNGPPAHSTLDRVAGELAAATAGAHDGHPTTRSVEEAKRNLKEACLSIGLPAPAILREVNALAARYGVPIVGSSAGVTAVWLDRIRTALPDIPVGPLDKEHMTEQATLLEALRAACRVRGRDEPRSLAQLNELATEIGLGSVSSWQTVSTRWLEALRASLQRQWTADRAPAPGTQPPATDGGTVKDKAERSFAGWIAAAPEGLTLDQLAADVLRARAAGTITDKAAEALLEAVDARGAELAAANLYPPDRQQQGEATEQSGGDPTAVGREIEAATAG